MRGIHLAARVSRHTPTCNLLDFSRQV